MLPQQYCLRWNNHPHNVLSMFEELLATHSFVDVTLACGEGEQLRAHKIVLSACSPYFQSLLHDTHDRHPIVLMREVSSREMRILLEFMYKGEVSVDQEVLPDLLRVAEGLQIKGLAEVNQKGQQQAALDALSLALGAQQQAQRPLQLSTAFKMSQLKSLQQRQMEEALAGLRGFSHASSSARATPPPKRKRATPRRRSGNVDPELLRGHQVLGEHKGKKLVKPITEELKREQELRAHEEVEEDNKIVANVEEEDEVGVVHVDSQPTTKAQATSPTELSETRASTSSPRGAASEAPDPTSATTSPSASSISTTATSTTTSLSSSSTSSTRSISEMSVRGLDLLRYANISSDGTYHCIACERLQVTKHFKNKYSFQRHAFLYHEGKARKVFPCPICHKEFSRPDKMKSHLKSAHDCVIPRSRSTNRRNSKMDTGKFDNSAGTRSATHHLANSDMDEEEEEDEHNEPEAILDLSDFKAGHHAQS